MKWIVKVNSEEELYYLKNADGYLLSIKNFSFRYNQSFSLSKTKRILSYCKKTNKQVYFNVNKIFKDEDLASLEVFLNKLFALDINGVFFTDFAVYMIAKKINQQDKCFFAHETFLRNSMDISTYQQCGIKNIICSKDMHIEDIQHLPPSNHYGIYCFGYMCLYQSQRKIISNYVKQYALDKNLINSKELFLKEEKRDGMYRVYQQDGYSFIFNDCVLSYLKDLKTLSQHITYFIIDGLFFSQEYLYQVLELFKNFKSEEELVKLDSTLSFSDGNLNTRIGLM